MRATLLPGPMRSAIGLMLLAPMLIAASDCESSSTPAGAGATASDGPRIFAVAQPMTASDGRSVTVVSFNRTFATGNQFDTPKKSFEYVRVVYALKNGSKADWTEPLWELKVIDANGQTYDTAWATGQGKVDGLGVGGHADAVTQIYEVPTGIALDVVWKPSMFGGQTFQTRLA